MGKYCGEIGFFVTEETDPGVWEQKITERKYIGDVLRVSRTIQSPSKINDNIQISNQISILADPYAYENFAHIIYISFMGAKWKVSTVEIQYPRLILTLGDLYNE